MLCVCRLILFALVLVSCRAAQNVKTQTAIDDKFVITADSSQLNRLKSLPVDTLSFYVKVIENVDQKVKEENEKLHKRILFWKIAAGVFLFLATGKLLGL